MLGAVDAVKIHGEYVPLRAAVKQIDNLSAHADADEIMSWLGNFTRAPKRTFVTHGEPAAARAACRGVARVSGGQWNALREAKQVVRIDLALDARQ